MQEKPMGKYNCKQQQGKLRDERQDDNDEEKKKTLK